MAKGKKSAPPRKPTSGSAERPAQGSPQLPVICTKYGQLIACVLATYLLFASVLPWLADLTPPGVNMSVVAEALVETVELQECPGACARMTCPSGWVTGLSPKEHCKCICKRAEPGRATEWDLERQKQHTTQKPDTEPPTEG